MRRLSWQAVLQSLQHPPSSHGGETLVTVGSRCSLVSPPPTPKHARLGPLAFDGGDCTHHASVGDHLMLRLCHAIIFHPFFRFLLELTDASWCSHPGGGGRPHRRDGAAAWSWREPPPVQDPPGLSAARRRREPAGSAVNSAQHPCPGEPPTKVEGRGGRGRAGEAACLQCRQWA